jgi:uncharacterized membrane-anchored protein
MQRANIIKGLSITMVLQLFVLCGMVVKAALPLYTGIEVRVKTVPVDPRSMFRGNYARLNYEITTLPANAFSNENEIRFGEVVYISLQPGEDGLYEFADATLGKPLDGVFMRARITSNSQPYRVKYGIEAFFAPKEKALQLESDLRNGGIAVLMVSDDGSVALKDVVPDEQIE